MNQLKKWLGIVWILLGPFAIYYLIKTAAIEIGKSPDTNTIIQWAVFVIIFFPIAIGMIIFGYYALKGEYSHLPENSKEI